MGHSSGNTHTRPATTDTGKDILYMYRGAYEPPKVAKERISGVMRVVT